MGVRDVLAAMCEPVFDIMRFIVPAKGLNEYQELWCKLLKLNANECPDSTSIKGL